MRIPLFLALCLMASPSLAAEPKAESPPASSAPSLEQVVASFNQENPHIRLDVKKGWVELDAKVCQQDAPMLEVLICLPMTREHESVLVTEAKPSQVHLGLLLLGLEPGAPRSVRWVGPQGDQAQVIPASGAEVALFVVYTTKVKVGDPGAEKEVEREVEVPVNEWLIDAKAQKQATSNRWLFAGSRMVKNFEGKQVYLADGEGNLASTVNFGDETLAPHSAKTKENDSQGEDLVCNPKRIPAVGTQVKVRIKPVNDKEKAASMPLPAHKKEEAK